MYTSLGITSEPTTSVRRTLPRGSRGSWGFAEPSRVCGTVRGIGRTGSQNPDWGFGEPVNLVGFLRLKFDRHTHREVHAYTSPPRSEALLSSGFSGLGASLHGSL